MRARPLRTSGAACTTRSAGWAAGRSLLRRLCATLAAFGAAAARAGEESAALPPTVSTETLVGAGDIAGCGAESDEATASLLDGIPGTVVTFGDNVYDNGTDAEFRDCYHPTWGRHKTRTRPASGNHDYHVAGAAGYFNYFGAAAGERGKGYYSYDLGGWHVIVLNSECAEVGGCGRTSPQGLWLQADLAAHPGACTLAYWHKPRFSSSFHGNNVATQDFWELLYAAKADVVLTGHDHAYERFARQNPAGVADPGRGIRQFVVGTGGAPLYPLVSRLANSEVWQGTTHGVLKLTLRPGGYDWQFVPVAGGSFTDSGSESCVDPPPALPADLAISKSDGLATAVAGGSLTYTIVASNAGPGPANGARVVDTFPAQTSGATWSCVASAGSGCGATSGAGNLNQAVNLAASGRVTFTARLTLSSQATGTLTNTASISPPAGIADPTPGNNSATDTDTILPAVNLSVTKTDGQATTSPGASVSYTIVARNTGPNPAVGATLSDNPPAGLTGVTWSCSGSGGGVCTASGSGAINDSVNLPTGGRLTYQMSGTVAAAPPGSTLRNIATVTAPAGLGDPNPADNSATDEDLLLCFGERIVVPDGRLTRSVIAPAASVVWLSQLKPGSSYSLELKNVAEDTAPGTLTVFSGEDGCSGTSTLALRDTSGLEPAAGSGTLRVSFSVTGTERHYRARLGNGGGAEVSYTIAWSETTLYSPSWTTNGAFDTYYSFQNTTSASLSGLLTLFDTAGTAVASLPLTVPAGRTTSVNTQAMGLARNTTGTARFSHDGAPGSVLAEAAIANFTLSPAYVQPVKFQAQRESR